MSSVIVLTPAELRDLVVGAVREAISTLPAVTKGTDGPGWLRVGDAAEHLDVDRTTIQRWIIDGTIPASARLPTGRTHRIAAWWVLNLNDDQVLDLYSVLNAGGELRVTIGIREHAECRFSYREADAYRGTREVARTVGDVDQLQVASGSAIAVSSGTLVTAAAEVVTWDSTADALNDELDRLASAQLRDRHVDVSLGKTGLDFTTLPPRTLLSTIDGGPGAIAVNANITTKSWDFVGRKTSWSNQRASKGVE